MLAARITVETSGAPQSPVPAEHAASGTTVRLLEEHELGAWDDLVDASPQGTLFCKSWWLRGVCPKARVIGCFENGRLLAGIPNLEHRYLFTVSTMPMCVPAWGPVIAPLEGKAVHVSSRETELLRALAEFVKKYRVFFQAFHPSLQNWLPFYWAGFRQTTRLTYVIPDLRSEQRLWGELTHQIRGEINKAERVGLTVIPCGIEAVFEAENKTYDRQGMRKPHSLEYLSRIYNTAAARDAGVCFAAVDGDGRVHAANLLVWDKNSAYLLAGGADPALRTSGATSLLIWELIRFAASHTAVFDFEGSSVPAIERFFRGFGGKQVPYNWVMKFPFALRAFLVATGSI